MHSVELARVVSFLILIIVIYLYAGAVFLRMLFKWPKGGTLRRWTDRVALLLALLGTGCILYARYYEPYHLSITPVRIASSKLPPGSRPIRIVHLSDIHSDATPRLELMLPEAVRQQKPDFIVMSGDYFNSMEGLLVFRKFLAELTTIAPTFVVKGNWETDHWPEARPFEGIAVHELDGKAVRLEFSNVPIWVAGLAAHHQEMLAGMLHEVPRDEFRIFIYHYPDYIYEAAKQGVDLYVAGHTHGGQVALPFYGALVTFSKFGKRFEAGKFRVDDTWLYVNRGLGVDGGFLPRVRFWAPPEMTVIDIEPID
jgi:uncharacterized protein